MARNGSSDGVDTNRRRLLQAMGAAGAAGLAGCSGLGGDESNLPEDLQQQLSDGFEEAGFETPWEGAIITNENPERVQWAQAIQDELNGTEFFDVELNQFEWTTYTGRILAEDSVEDEALVCLGWSAGWDPDAYIRNLFHSDQHTPACCNVNHFADEEIDSLIDEGTATTDIDERADIYQDAQESIVEASPISFIRFDEEIDAYRSAAVDGWETYPINGGKYYSVYAPWADVHAEVTGDSAGDENELIATFSADVANTDPIAMNDTTSTMSGNLIYEGLMGVDYDGEPQLVLAEDMEKVSDTEYVFTLREGVQFHPSEEFDFEGREMTAEDVKFSMERYLGTTREADVGDWLGVPDTPEGEAPESFEGNLIVEDDYTLRIELPKAYAPFQFTVGEALVVPREVGDGDLDLSTEPIGTGAYRFDQYDPDELWRVQAFDDHWYDGSGDVPADQPIETVTFRVVTESSARESALRSGDVDLAQPPQASLAALEEEEGFTVTTRIAGGYDMFIYPMNADTPFQSQDVRLAVNRLIDREGIISAVYDGSGSPAYTPISPLAGAFTSEEFNQEMGDEYSRYYDA
jgi:peptide/nickel transport system substrate-binding protein